MDALHVAAASPRSKKLLESVDSEWGDSEEEDDAEEEQENDRRIKVKDCPGTGRDIIRTSELCRKRGNGKTEIHQNHSVTKLSPIGQTQSKFVKDPLLGGEKIKANRGKSYVTC